MQTLGGSGDGSLVGGRQETWVELAASARGFVAVVGIWGVRQWMRGVSVSL